MDRRVQLKVKIKSLAAEARIIRHEETRGRSLPLLEGDVRPEETTKDGHPFNTQKAPKRRFHFPVEVRHELYCHRIGVVRPEARATQLAYAFLRGKACSEGKHREPSWTRTRMWDNVRRMVSEYGLLQTDNMSGADFKAQKAIETGDLESWIKAAEDAS